MARNSDSLTIWDMAEIGPRLYLTPQDLGAVIPAEHTYVRTRAGTMRLDVWRTRMEVAAFCERRTDRLLAIIDDIIAAEPAIDHDTAMLRALARLAQEVDDEAAHT